MTLQIVFKFNCEVCGNEFAVIENLKKHKCEKHKSAVRLTHRQLNTKLDGILLQEYYYTLYLIVVCVELNLQLLKT